MKATSARSSGAMLFLASALMCANLAHAQSFKKVSVKGGARVKQVVSGATSAWALATNGNPYIFKTNKFVPANTISLTQIAVGGGSLLQPDTVWGLDGAGRIFNAVKSGTTWVFNQVPGTLDFISIGIGYNDSCHPYEVWGLNPSAMIFRFNYCSTTWEQIPGTLGTLSTGGGEVWGLNGNGEVYRFDFSSLSFVRIGTTLLRQITVGPDLVWGRSAFSQQMFEFQPGSGDFTTRASTELDDIQAGGDGVWALNPRGTVYVLRHSEWNWIQIAAPGQFSFLSVGAGAGVFGIDSTGQVFAFTPVR